MTLHWWQHWFWITGPAGRRRGVALLLVLVCFHTWSYGCCLAWGRRPQRVAPSASAEQHWLLPVAAGPRRLLGFAGPPFRDDTAPSQTDTEYLTVPTPRASGAREPKAIGVPVATSPSYTLATSSASAATSVAEIVEELTPSPTPAPEAVDVGDHVTWSTPSSTVSSPSSAVVETGTPEGAMSSGEMANDEPEQARDPASTSASSAATERADPAETAGSSMFTSPSSTPGGGSGVSPTVAILNASRSRDLVPALHPGLSPAQGPTSAPPSPSAAPESSSEPSSEPSSPPSEHSSPASISEPPNSHRSAAPLAASTSNSGRHHHPSAQGPHQGHHQGPGAMSLSAGGGLDAGSITGIVLGIVVFAGLVGTVSFVLYRRRYLNKPQTLNDKCSNPDSSGYIDDSTFRENSEEMYSLDNDSFLNSLEAMTIQNYWTDTVKHTKL